MYHCDYCRCPIEDWKPLKTYNSHKSCELYSDFIDIIWELEESKRLYTYDEILNKCLKISSEYQDIRCLEDSVKEMIDIGKNTGLMLNYRDLKKIA